MPRWISNLFWFQSRFVGAWDKIAVFALILIVLITTFGWDVYRHWRMIPVDSRIDRIVETNRTDRRIKAYTIDYSFIPPGKAEPERERCRRVVDRRDPIRLATGDRDPIYAPHGTCLEAESVAEYDLPWHLRAIGLATVASLILFLGVTALIAG